MVYKFSDASTVSNASKKLTLRDYLNLNQLSSKKKEAHSKVEVQKDRKLSSPYESCCATRRRKASTNVEMQSSLQ
jgi:hypothetical protein